ncbi:hypothetical protein [Consotaella aegiceratis]|uniref:hypothetical protein n=1 Tax=Consotaella aegiceratis TaxID=3097961 RepID=UPI002F427FC1
MGDWTIGAAADWAGRIAARIGRGWRGGSLDQIAELVDWTEIDRHLAPICASAKGERASPRLALFKALLLAVWHDLSDGKLTDALDDALIDANNPLYRPGAVSYDARFEATGKSTREKGRAAANPRMRV